MKICPMCHKSEFVAECLVPILVYVDGDGNLVGEQPVVEPKDVDSILLNLISNQTLPVSQEIVWVCKNCRVGV